MSHQKSSFAFNSEHNKDVNASGSSQTQDGNVNVVLGMQDPFERVSAFLRERPAGRIYHDEHFVMGQLVGADGMVQDPTGSNRLDTSPKRRESNTGTLPLAHQATNNLRRAPTTGLAGAMSMGLPAPAPMPKWPANWQSAAFEAVAVKKSYILSPPEIYAECTHHGEEKAKFSWYKMMMLSTVAGCYVGFGYTTCLQIGGLMDQRPSNHENPDEVNIGVFRALFGAMGFPFGFATIVVCGAELYTSMCAYSTCALWEGKISVLTALRMLIMTWVGNFIGCLIMVALFYAAQTYGHGRNDYLVYVAQDKVKYGWGAVLVKGIFANWLVGIATWMANAAQDLTGKFVGIWLPISAFAAIGFEHCIANQFLFPMAWAMGAHVTAKQFIWGNLIPSTIGNWIGGAVCIATTYAMVYGRTPLRIAKFYNNHIEPYIPWGANKKGR